MRRGLITLTVLGLAALAARAQAVKNSNGGTATVTVAGTVPVSGTFWPATQPVSGAVTAAQGAPGTSANAWPVALTNGAGSGADFNGTRLKVQAEALGNGNSEQDVRADSWGDGASNSVQQVMTFAATAGWNGSSFDRLRTSGADGSGKTGVLETAANTGGYYEINAAATTAVKATPGLLHKLIVNTPAAGTIGLYDVAGASCTGTPGSGRFALITLTSSSQPETLSYDLKLSNGLCVVTSAAADLTVTVE